MKKTISAILAIYAFFVCVLPCHADGEFNADSSDYIYVDFDEFYGNRAHYDVLLLQGYTIIVNVGEDHADEEIARLTQPATTLHQLVPSLTRGTTTPTAEYDVHSNLRYHFTCNAKYDLLYTNYKFYGCVVYLIDGFNTSYNNNLKIRVFGTSQGTIDFSVPPRASIYRVIGTGLESQRWFPMFYPPSEAYGEIYCIGH